MPEDFAYQKAIAHFDGAWRRCARQKCRRLAKCCGGPRGTLRRLAKRGATPLPACRTTPPRKAPPPPWDRD